LEKHSRFDPELVKYVLIVAVPETGWQRLKRKALGTESGLLTQGYQILHQARMKLDKPLQAHFIEINSLLYRHLERNFPPFKQVSESCCTSINWGS
jgi:hypothetical protein